jgi:DNA/RNA endonuclease G (NUC1)
MRALLLLTAILAAGCASQPTTPKIPSSGGTIAASDAQSLALARNLNLKVIDKDGQQLFCRSNYVTTSRIQRDTTCYTAEQLDQMQAQLQRNLDQFSNTPSSPAKFPP